MRIENEYTMGLKRPSGYNPNNFTALGGAIFYLCLLVTFFVLPYALALGGFYELLLSFEDDYLVFLVDIIISQGIILAFGLVYSLIKRANPVHGGGYVIRFDPIPMLFGAALVIGLQICLGAFHNEFSEAASYFGSPAVGGLIDTNNMKGNPLWILVYAVLMPTLPCICEEIVFRGILMRGFKRFGAMASIILSSAMFSLFHGNYQQLMLQFLGGLVIGACMYVTKNFAVAMFMHFTNNLFAMGHSFVLSFAELSGAMYNVTFVFVSIIGVGLLLVGGTFFVKVYAKKKAGIKYSPEFGRAPVSYPVLVSEKGRAEESSIVIDAMQLDEFVSFYPDAMRYKKGGFVPMNKDVRSKKPAVIMITICFTVAIALIVLNGFGI